ncbi:MAG: hypothetical protein SPJ78_09645 [Corynebacterium camporealensis]|uniref:hypothetical protein n=1 Tax=Corynebacterium camporealensis TaxID=161896 RepID=UPI002A91CA4B|nr:hypothetical protein [Corynebacterium camporealensis]MDY5840954.1 hypothetical protein [Corynebacterium camporealensis]
MLSDACVSETEDSADEDVEDDEVADEDDEVSEELLELDAGSESGLEQPTSRRAPAMCCESRYPGGGPDD